MKAKSALFFAVLVVLSLILCIVASPGRSYAGNPEGTVCFQDNVGDLWFLDFGSYFSGLNFDIHGFLTHSEIFCNGTFIEPVSGTATLGANNTIVLGLSSIAVGGGATDSTGCETTFWHVVIDEFTFETILGSFVGQKSGVEKPFTLTEIDCNSFPLMAAGKKSQSLKGRLQR